MLKIDRIKRKRRVRAKVWGTALKPRLSVYRSNVYIYAQVIDDDKAHTLAAAKGTDSVKVGEEIAKKAKEAKVTTVVFDRNGFLYHGRIKSLADAARSGGLKF